MEHDLIKTIEDTLAHTRFGDEVSASELRRTLTAALTLAKALTGYAAIPGCPNAREALAIAAKQIGGSDGK